MIYVLYDEPPLASYALHGFVLFHAFLDEGSFSIYKNNKVSGSVGRLRQKKTSGPIHLSYEPCRSLYFAS